MLIVSGTPDSLSACLVTEDTSAILRIRNEPGSAHAEGATKIRTRTDEELLA